MPGQQPAQPTESNTLALVGFILSFLVPLAGLIVSILGYRKSKQLNNNGKGLALGGIVISGSFMVLVVVGVLVLVIAGVSDVNEEPGGANDLFESQQLPPTQPE